MAGEYKHDHMPLLPPGRHPMTLADVKTNFLDPFPDNPRRKTIFQRLEMFWQDVLAAGFCCEVWLDGSFLTEKPEPDDLDVTLILDADVGENLSPEQEDFYQRAATGYADGIDSFAFTRRRRHLPGTSEVNPDFGDEMFDPAYHWGHQYGLENSDTYLKGFVILKVRETDVGIRICS